MTLTGEDRSARRKTCPSATLPTTNLTCADPGLNPGLRGGRPATNRLSHGTAQVTTSFMLVSVCLSVWNNSDLATRIFVQFYTGDLQ
jgi:hypothetical protein